MAALGLQPLQPGFRPGRHRDLPGRPRQLRADDDVRALQNAPRSLLDDQRRVGELMQMAGPANSSW
ncbi:Uncharacterised protein [Chromobacterium violaceum]|uniref:Uncharacterized protein n=1 Tax=Chromobacterium violaceum TaxID=536 RepID=A0A3S4HLU6_CHRVL|nr:Uncharacterised protein [Chromobacterium violaceum]